MSLLSCNCISRCCSSLLVVISAGNLLLQLYALLLMQLLLLLLLLQLFFLLSSPQGICFSRVVPSAPLRKTLASSAFASSRPIPQESPQK